MLHKRLVAAQTSIAAALERVFDDRDSPFFDVNLWSEDVIERLREYALRGKLIRGSLVPFAYWLFTGVDDVPDATIDAGVTMELLQSFLLIHDDIMDQDDLRRGLPSIHRQYREAAPVTVQTDAALSEQYGVSMGICVGDVSAFFAIHRLSRLDVDPEQRARIIELVAREITVVGLAQMQDVHHGYVEDATEEAVLDVYTYKTGRYTFSLPMAIGAILAGVDRDRIKEVMLLGEELGRIFQIRDDRLGILEDSTTTGKQTGGDIRENKKTLYRAFLFDRLPEDHPVRTIFGKPELSDSEIEMVHAVLDEYDVIADVDARVESEAARARQTIDRLDLATESREALESLVDFNLKRRV